MGVLTPTKAKIIIVSLLILLGIILIGIIYFTHIGYAKCIRQDNPISVPWDQCQINSEDLSLIEKAFAKLFYPLILISFLSLIYLIYALSYKIKNRTE